jgi:DNA polymerase-3 subunit epsilon
MPCKETVDVSPLSRTALKAKRLKPAPDQEPVKRVWSRKRRAYIELFDPLLCVSMPARRPPSAAQLVALEAGRRKVTHADCAGCSQNFERHMLNREGLCPACVDAEWQAEQQERDAERQAALLELVDRATPGRTVYMDTETTGLYGECGDELLELALVDDAGIVLLESLVKPERHTEWPDAQAIHGITPADVANAPSLESLLPRLFTVIENAGALVIYNADFDLAFLPDSVRQVANGKAICAMQAFSLHAGDWNVHRQSYRWYKLMSAAHAAGHKWEGSAHRALADAMATRTVWRWLRDRASVP